MHELPEYKSSAEVRRASQSSDSHLPGFLSRQGLWGEVKAFIGLNEIVENSRQYFWHMKAHAQLSTEYASDTCMEDLEICRPLSSSADH